MSIIYSYPIKSTPVSDDLILISDSASSPQFATKQIKVSSLPSSGAGITLTTTGTSGVATLVGTVLNIPNYTTTGGTPTLPLNSVQFNNNGSFGGSGDFKYNDSTKVLTIGDQDVNRGIISIAGGSSGAGELRLGDPGTSGGTVTLKGGNDHATSYTIKLPDDGPSANNKILESDASGNLTWINTPTGSGGISFSGSTLNGIATYSNSTTATVSSVFTISGNKLSAPAGTLADPSIEVGAVGGLYAASGAITLAHTGADAIGVSSASIINYKLTQFNSGLKFGSTGSTLSTYTEATWTSGPTLTFSVGGAATLSASAGSYRVIGDMVFAQFEFTFSSGGYGTADLSLPVSGVAGTGSINFVKMNSNVGNSTVSTPVTGNINVNSASIRLKSFNYDQDSASHVSGQLFELVDTSGQPIFQNGDIVSGTIIYRKA